MTDTLQDLRYALRILLKSPGFSATAIVVLALGIGANTAIFSVVNAVLLRPLPYRDPDRLVMVWEKIPNFGPGNTEVTQADFFDFREQNQVFDNIAAFENRSFNLSGSSEPQRITGARVSASLFPTLGVQPFRGRTFTAEEDHPGRHHVVVASYGLWQRRFGSDPNFVGKTIHLDREPYTVIGIMPREFQFPIKGMPRRQAAELWVPIAFTGEEIQARGNTFNTTLIARLQPGVSLARAAADASTIAHRIHEKYPVRIQKMFQLDGTVTSLREEVVGKIRPALLLLLGAVAFVLLIGCANVANLLLAKAAARQREIVIRAALGAGRGRLVRWLLTESVLLSLIGGAAGLLIAMWGADLLIAFSPGNIPRLEQTGVDRWVLAFALVASLATGIGFGLVPALQASRADLSAALREGGRGVSLSMRRSRLRSLLVIGEVALSLVLVIGAGLLIKSFARLRTVDTGFRPENLLIMSIALPDSKYPKATEVSAFYQALLERVAALPGVPFAGAGTNIPMQGRWTIMFTPDTVASPVWGKTLASNTLVAGDYFQAMGIPLRRGRYFTPDDKEGALRAVIVNETLARRHWPGEDAVGKRLKWGSPQSTDPWLTIVGVVGDVREGGLDAEIQPGVSMPYAQTVTGSLQLGRNLALAVRTTGEPSRLVAAVRREVASLDRELPVFAVRTMDQIIGASIAPRRFHMLLLGVFAALALLLAAIGLYGVMSYSVGQYTHEIGLRMALGASAADVLRMVIGQGMRLAGLGLAIGVAAALALTRVLSSFLFGVSPTDWTVFAAVSTILAAVAFSACYLPARRATRVDPMVALRYE